jgi:hypothetical protein
VGADQHRSQPAEENRAGECGDLGLPHSVSQQPEGVRAHPVRREVVGLVEIDVVDLVAGDKGFDIQGLVTLGNRRGNLFRFEHDEIAVLDLVALDLIVPLDRFACFAVDEFTTNTVSGCAIERVESDALGRGGGGV